MGSSPISSFFYPAGVEAMANFAAQQSAEMSPIHFAVRVGAAKLKHRITGFLIVVLAAAIVFCMTGFSLPQEVFIHGQGRI